MSFAILQNETLSIFLLLPPPRFCTALRQFHSWTLRFSHKCRPLRVIHLGKKSHCSVCFKVVILMKSTSLPKTAHLFPRPIFDFLYTKISTMSKCAYTLWQKRLIIYMTKASSFWTALFPIVDLHVHRRLLQVPQQPVGSRSLSHCRIRFEYQHGTLLLNHFHFVPCFRWSNSVTCCTIFMVFVCIWRQNRLGM